MIESASLPISNAVDTLPADLLAGAPSVTTLRKRFDEARSTLGDAREKAQRDRDYFDGPEQLNSDVRKTLKLRNQPAIYTNRIRPAINGVLGVLEGARSDPRAYGRNPDDEQSADVATKTLRFIADQSSFGDIKQDVAENFLIEGTGAVIVEMIENKITPTQIRYEEFYHDPYSRRPDLADARYMGIAKWMDADQLKKNKAWAARINQIGDPMSPQDAGIAGVIYQDRPSNMAWVDNRRRRVMLVEEYAIEDGEWKRIVYVAAGVLEYGPSPYLEFVQGGGKRPCCPIEAQSCYVDKRNQRYGIVRDMIPVQDEVNARRSRALHTGNSRQVQNVDPSAPPVDADTVRLEAAKADGVIPMGWQIIPPNGIEQSNVLLLQEAKGEIERMAPQGLARDLESGSAISGRARQVAQAAGMTELARPLGRLAGWELRVYRQAWNRARQFWTDPMYIRITDDVKAPSYLKVNEPKLGMVMAPATGPDGQPQIDPATGQPAMRPTMGVVGMDSRLAEMDVDIILDTVPDTATLEHEVWGELRELASSFAAMGISIMSPEFELMIELSPLADKARIIEKLKAVRDEQAQQQQAEAQKAEQARQLALQGEAAKVRETSTRADLNEVNATKIAAETMSALDTHANTPHMAAMPDSGAPD